MDKRETEEKFIRFNLALDEYQSMGATPTINFLWWLRDQGDVLTVDVFQHRGVMGVRAVTSFGETATIFFYGSKHVSP